MAMDIRNVRNITDLVSYFSQNLDWDIDIDDFDTIEDVSYDFSAADIGLKEESFAKISSLRQLQPLVDGQKWGIFCVEFDSNKFEVSALRKILSGLVPRRRNSVDHAVWIQQDLLFICNWGTDNNRTIGIAHFEDQESGLPQIKMISCAPALEDFTQIKVFEDRLANLKWPRNTSNIEEWRTTWSSAFTTGYRQIIQDSSTLTVQLAAEAQEIRNRILDILKVETKNGYVHLLYDKFKDTLVHDMKETDFADMYAQTLVYGLFSARCMDETQDDFSAAEAIECLPNTNPFLKNLMRDCLSANNNSILSFDELEISNIVDLLKNTNTSSIIQDFNRQTGGGKEDPVIHFYEEFLTAYDKAQKVQRGVYYTPQPVVNFMVRAVDYILKNEFGYEDGLATTETKTIKIKRQSKTKRDGLYHMIDDTEEVPAVQVLDPATGTGTFIRQIILQIYENFKKKNKYLSSTELKKAWNVYVPKHLLPRLNAFELMMAPYAVAHMKLAMVLKDTGYDFKSPGRLNVFLTNTLEEPGNSDMQQSLFEDPLATESIAANIVKKNSGINVVIGNPPYNVSSSNSGSFIMKMISEYKQNLNEKKINLDDDYIKFIRYAEEIVSKNENGILAYISNNSFIDGITHREMRKHLLGHFSSVYILDLHGNARKREISPDGSKDENVFDIMQGVSINLFIKNAKKNGPCAVYHYDLYGERSYKYAFLSDEAFSQIPYERIATSEPYYFFVPKDFEDGSLYENGISVTELFPLFNSGIQTKRDKITVGFTAEDVQTILNDFKTLEPENLRTKYNLPEDGRDWTISSAKKDVLNNDPAIVAYEYRPYDCRNTAYSGISRGFIGYPRDLVMKHFLTDNIGLLTTRSHSATSFRHVFATKHISDIHSVSDQTYVFPLFVYSDDLLSSGRKLNIDTLSAAKLLSKTGIKYDESESLGRLIFGYTYAVLHSDQYRTRNKDYLKIDFPKIPVANNKEQFMALAELGLIMVKLHIGESDIDPFSNIHGSDMKVEKITYKDDCVFFNKTSYFDNVSEETWNYLIGSYNPIQHFFKDRKNRMLTGEEIEAIRYMIFAISKTIEISSKIEEIVQS